jgi:hypothetical protein
MKHLPPDQDPCLALPGVQVLGAFQRALHLALTNADIDGLCLHIVGAPESLSPLSDPDHLFQVAGVLAKCLVATWSKGGEIAIHVDMARLRAPLAHRYGLIGAGRFTTVSACCTVGEPSMHGISDVPEDQVGTSSIARAFGHVRAAGGHFLSENEGVGGISFTIYLPVPRHLAVMQGTGASARAGSGDSETILLIDNNSAIRHVARRTQGWDHRHILLLPKPFSPAHV